MAHLASRQRCLRGSNGYLLRRKANGQRLRDAVHQWKTAWQTPGQSSLTSLKPCETMLRGMHVSENCPANLSTATVVSRVLTESPHFS